MTSEALKPLAANCASEKAAPCRLRNLPGLRERSRRLGGRAISDEWCIISWFLDSRPASLNPAERCPNWHLHASEPQSPLIALFCLNFGFGEVFPVLPGFDTLIVFSECTISVESLSPVIFTVACLGPSYMTYIIYAFRRARTEPEQAVLCPLPL